MKKFLFLIFSLTNFAIAQAKINVVATLPDFGALAREVGGANIELTVLAKPTEDPHFVDARPSFVVALRSADVLVDGGAELEPEAFRRGLHDSVAAWLASLGETVLVLEDVHWLDAASHTLVAELVRGGGTTLLLTGRPEADELLEELAPERTRIVLFRRGDDEFHCVIVVVIARNRTGEQRAGRGIVQRPALRAQPGVAAAGRRQSDGESARLPPAVHGPRALGGETSVEPLDGACGILGGQLE